ncbi:hypothetical protein CYL21_5232 [Plasmodium falciparum NF54]|uniref:Protein phosphatase PPM12, putative n=2 Tax=Plasmodium falciparum TaxID=5833 RepID=Q8IC22_PLAF7|nr:protein phosphatase PPM12, putative [Plasmodium falciparum 3D7]EWC89472.1 hypothetical protein PFNF54_01684 [Plasmodium falciparum NF54]KAF4326909.1 hypothetical protein CYL21_5232 [Plasmodium falciparum NF54]PKC42259.1 hypothetical protein CK202_5496 [Plasmodium falciparum NF54]CAD50819.1 protein phosphatase PPM12, putative [Plasmodium falciparum 3D7]|eukprot:XP_001348981.1 conserved Plasmodium protein, unknown function [Plasmodium falciparum 3D7]
MEKLLHKCLHVNRSENGLDEEESVFQTCKIFVGLENEISEVNCIDNKNIGNDFLCGFDNYAKKNCVEGIWMDELNGRKSGYMNLNEYYENKFNIYFNIENIDYPLKFYKTIYFNFFSSFIENEDREYILNENINILNNFYENIRNQKYLLLHNAHSIPHEKKKINSNYKNGDAHMCSDNIISIADGVSSIKNSGINVSNFSNDLLKKCLNLHLYRCINKSLFEYQNDVIFKHYNLKYKDPEFLKPIICRSACSSNFLGASTLLFASVENDKLHICTIGDCQMLIINLKEHYFKHKFFEKIHIKVQTSKQMLCLQKRESNVTTIVDEEKEKFSGNIYNQILNSNQNSIVEKNYDNYKQSSSSLNFDMSDKKMDKENVNSWDDIIYDNSKSELSKSESSKCKSSNWELNKSDLDKAHLDKADMNKAHLDKADMNKAHLDKADMNKADMNKAHLDKAHLDKTHLTNSDLAKSELTNSELAQSDLSKPSSVQSKIAISNITPSHILLEDSRNINTNSVGSDKTYTDTNKSSISELYLKRNKLCENVLYSDINVNMRVEESEETILYVEYEINEDIYEKFQKCLSECDYKIGDLSFNLKEDNLYDCSNIRSDTIISHNFSDTTENDTSENEKNEKKYISGMTNTLDNEIGYRNLLNFFQIDRNSILKRKKNKYDEIWSNKVNLSYDWMNDLDNKESNKLQEDKTELNNNTNGNNNNNNNNNSNNSNNNYNNSNNNNNNYYYYNSCKNKKNFNHYRYRHDYEEECPFDIIHKSKIQQHYFNCPYQITFMPSNFSNDNMKNKKSNNSFNSTINMNKYNDIITKCLRYCDYSTIDLKNNYIIISGSDGLFDNLYDDDIMKIIFNYFYILKDNKFIKLKEFIKFNEEFKKAISWIYKTISNSRDKDDTYKEDIYFSKQSNDVYNKNLIKKKDTEEIDRNEFNRDLTKSENSISEYEKGKGICIHGCHDQNVCNNDNNINCDKHHMNENNNEIIKKKGSNLFLNKFYSKGSFNSTMSKFNFVPKIKKIFSFKEKNKCDIKDQDKLNPSFSYLSNVTLNNTYEKQKEDSEHCNSMCDNKDLKKMNIPNFESADTLKTDESFHVVRNDIRNMKYDKNYNKNNDMLNQQNTFDVISKTYDIKNDFSIDIELNNIRYNKKKRTFIIEKKIEAQNVLCNSSNLILFDENMNIYLNTKKACDEIIELSSILSNQQVNYSLLKKRRKKYNNDKENKKNKKKSFTASLFSNIQEKEKYLFDNINYDDIQSNKSNDKIILTPISEFIFDKYKKYFNMGKPDDTTVIVSIVKENKYI